MTATPTWPVFEAALVERDMVAEGTMAFRFAKPVDWTYRAGQFIDITLLDPPETDGEGNTRGFSISSAPSEDVIMVTTRLRDTAFKRVLRTMPIGTRVKIEGPFGDLRLQHFELRLERGNFSVAALGRGVDTGEGEGDRDGGGEDRKTHEGAPGLGFQPGSPGRQRPVKRRQSEGGF